MERRAAITYSEAMDPAEVRNIQCYQEHNIWKVSQETSMQHEGVQGLCRPEFTPYGAGVAHSTQGRYHIRNVSFEACE